MEEGHVLAAETEGAVKWRPLSPRQRRVIGVLIEKAKTTPEAYPMTPNAIVTGCNQKTNRSPLTSYTADDIEDIVTELREMGAVIELQGGGRVPRYKHCMYEWLGVSKVELAVMAELLLRGEQTVGDLRSRAARMEPIADLQELRPILSSLVDKKLVMPLTPEGRGQVVTHALYKDRELEELHARYAAGARSVAVDASDDVPERTSDARHPSREATVPAGISDQLVEFQLEMADLRAEISRLRDRVEQLESHARSF